MVTRIGELFQSWKSENLESWCVCVVGGGVKLSFVFC